MKSVYHDRGLWRASLAPVWRHWRRWSTDPAYRALHRFARQLRHRPRFSGAQVMFEGKPVKLCDAPSFLSAWDEIFVNRIYEIGPFATSPRFVDAGANLGLAALYWRRRYGPISYVGFEPDPAIAELCRANLRAWDVGGQLVEAAVGANPGRTVFRRDHADGGRVIGGNLLGSSELEVRVEALAPYLRDPVDLLKIDIEGAEAEVLPALVPALGTVRRLFLEWHFPADVSAGFGQTFAALEAAGFCVAVQSLALHESPFTAPGAAEGFRQQLNLYAVRA